MSLRRRLLATNLVLAGLVSVVFVVLLVAVLSLRQATNRAQHSADVIESVESTQKSVLDLETGARGFGLTGQEKFLEPWHLAQGQLPGETTQLRHLVADNPKQARLSRRIALESAAYLHLYSIPFVTMARHGLSKAAALAQTGEGKRRVDALRGLFNGMLVNEERLAASRRHSVDSRRTLAIVAVAVGLLICLLFVLLQQTALRRWVLEPTARLAGAARRLRRGDLAARAAVPGTDEVARLGADFDAMAASLQETDTDLRRSNAELEQFAYVASHDLAEPLRVMAGYADLLSRKYSGELDERADRYILGITDGSERMRRLIDDLLAYSRAGRRELDMRRVDIGQLVDTVRGDLSVAINEAHAEIVHDGLPTVTGDAAQLRIVLQNLIANAVKFRSPDRRPRVEVVGARDERAWRLEVHDNGIGIEARHTDRIFRMFQRLHTREEYEGTGIGLALCQRVVERHGGRIWAGPGDDGVGTTISFTIADG
ncbi:MAG TPA: CHASE3 domain-containing protein [Solirubrobacteraceae bacterium]